MKLPFVLAKRFVAAENLEDSLPVVKSLNDQGLLVTLDLLGEYISDLDKAVEAAAAYKNILNRLEEERPNGLESTISIKLSMMGQKLDEEYCLARAAELLETAKATDTFVRFDMEGTDITDSTLSIFEKLYPSFPDHVGVVLQSYLHRTRDDVARMCELNARVRICKGAYKEPQSVAYQKMSDIRDRFMEYSEMLLVDARYPGIATHDDILIDQVKTLVKEKEVGNDQFEFQMLFGMRPSTQLSIAKEGYNMRVYVPYGTEWFPYFTRRLRERKENIWFVAKTMIKG